MVRYAICCIGHITLDKVVTPSSTVFMPGGTAYYFSHAIASLCSNYLLVTAVADSEIASIKELESSGIKVNRLPTRHTVAFENCYGENIDERTQRVWQQADAFQLNDLAGIEAGIFHLGPLLPNDIPGELIHALSTKGQVSLDVQGLVREVKNEQVIPTDWKEKKQLLPFIHYLKANEEEMHMLTGTSDVEKGSKQLADWGAKEVIVTLGSNGAVVFSENKFYQIPVCQPKKQVDATGCGDTYMAGYLFKRSQGTSIHQAGEFAAVMAALKLEVSGPFRGTQKEVEAILHTAPEAKPRQNDGSA